MDLIGIGEFGRLSRLSPKALRLYDELGLLPPAHVDLDSGYRRYAAGQLDQARLVASLRQIGVPLAQIKVILRLDEKAAAEQVADYWTGAEVGHAARRELVGYLVDRLNGKRSAMYEVAVRDIPARSLAARFPDLTLRAEPAHQEAFIHLGQDSPEGAQWQVAGDALFGWVLEQHRKPNGGARMILIPRTGDPSAGRGPDFDLAVALR